MRLKTSYFNMLLFLEGFKKQFWVFALYSFSLTILIPLRIVSNDLGSEPIKKFGSALLHYSTDREVYSSDQTYALIAVALLLMVVPMLAGILSFRYLQKPNLYDQMLTLPLPRKALFNTAFLCGLTLFIGPILINAAVLFVLKFTLYLPSFQVLDIVVWTGFSLLIACLIYSLSVFFGIITGTSSLQAILTVVFLGLPAGLILLIDFVFINSIFGYAGMRILARYYTPVFRVLDGCEDFSGHFVNNEIAPYVIITVLLYGGSIWLHKRRLAENTGSPVVFKSFRVFFKYLATFCSGLVGSCISFTLFKGELALYAGYLLGGIFGYMISEMVLHNSIKGALNPKGAWIGIILLVLSAGALHFDMAGFERWTANDKNIVQIYMGTGLYSPLNFKDPENIARIIELHKEIVQTRRNPNLSNGDGSEFQFITQDGKLYSRYYAISESEYEEKLRLIYESDEGRYLLYPILTVDQDNVKSIVISRQYNENPLSIIDPELVQEGLAAIREDSLKKAWNPEDSKLQEKANLDFVLIEPVITSKNPISDQFGHLIRNSINVNWQYNDVNFMSFLIKNNLLEKVRSSTTYIEKVMIKEISTPEDLERYVYGYRRVNEDDSSAISVVDPTEIEGCLETPSYHLSDKNVFYAFTIYYKGSHYEDIGIYLKLPETLMNKFKNARR